MKKFIKQYSDVPTGFVEDFFDISKESYEDDEFAIDFEIIADWFGSRKDNLKLLLVNNFEEDYDYIIDKIKVSNKFIKNI